MDAFERFIGFLESNYAESIYHRSERPPLAAQGASFPETLTPALKDFLLKQGITQLYSHQRSTFDLVQEGQDTVVLSRTASGKTLAFLLPILDAYIKDPSFSVLFLYPTKALSRDQESKIRALLQHSCPSAGLGTFDGDTPVTERARIQKSCDFMVSNPDMLHSGILPNYQRKWRDFLTRLRFIVIDEVHVYRGVYGSHVAHVLKRLQRVAQLLSSRPQFVCSSATIANPEALASALCGRSFKAVTEDGSPRHGQRLYFINPRMVKTQGNQWVRKGPASVSVSLLRESARLGVRSICFGRARQEVERIYQAVVQGQGAIKNLVKPYRGGFLSSERHQLEQGLRSGSINTVISTNALELGIDIGDLQVCILSGHPGTIASFWQQAGRVGRDGKPSAIIFIARNTSIDQFLVHHPDYIQGAPVEEAFLSPANPYILLQHLPCAAYEYPMALNDSFYHGELVSDALQVLHHNETLSLEDESYFYAARDYPARGVSLRGMTDHNIQIIHEGKVIGELDPIGARGTLYKDAIYQHMGTKFMSLDLDLAKKTCLVAQAHVDYYTEAVWQSRVELTTPWRECSLAPKAHLVLGELYVNRQPKIYKKIKEQSFENIGYGPITLEPFEYHTTGFSMQPGEAWVTALWKHDKRCLSASIYGLSYLLHSIAPMICMGDMKDMSTDVYIARKKDAPWQTALYLYDTHEGGVGFAERIFDRFLEVVALSQRILQECECAQGCPACVPPLPPGLEEDAEETGRAFYVTSNAAAEATRSLIAYLLEGRILLPEVQFARQKETFLQNPQPMDMERQQQQARLANAAETLMKKRLRLH